MEFYLIAMVWLVDVAVELGEVGSRVGFQAIFLFKSIFCDLVFLWSYIAAFGTLEKASGEPDSKMSFIANPIIFV